MKRTTAILAAAVFALSACDEQKEGGSVRGQAPGESSAASSRRSRSGKPLPGVFASDPAYLGAATDASGGGASEFFDGARSRSGAGGLIPASYAASVGSGARRIAYTAFSDRPSPGQTGAPPLPTDYEYPAGVSGGGVQDGGGRTLVDFVRFQVESRLPSITPVLSRAGWGPRATRGMSSDPDKNRVTVHHTQGPRPMSDAETAQIARNIQHYHMVGRAREGKEPFADIGYHFLIAGHGMVVEGRRAELLGAHAGGRANDRNLGIAMMGDFNKMQPTPAQIESLTRLITFLSIKYDQDPGKVVAKRGRRLDEFIEPHNHYNSTDCPGRHMLAIIDSLRATVSQEKGTIVTRGGFTPLAVVGRGA
jgi:hypothetical protein